MSDEARDPVTQSEWSPYRKAGRPPVEQRRDEVVLSLDKSEESAEDWDPVMKVEYLTDLEETEPAEDLILETRRNALANGPQVDDE